MGTNKATKSSKSKTKRNKGRKFRAFTQNVQADAQGKNNSLNPFLDKDANPFESHFRNVAHKKADDARVDLIKEYKNISKSGGITDRRFMGGTV
jgi:hypothetical protein